MSIDRGTDKEDVVHIYDGILAIKKKEIMPFAATWMDLEIIILSEISQTEKDKYMIAHIWNLILKNDTNEFIYKTETDLQILKSTLWLPKGKHGAGRDK